MKILVAEDDEAILRLIEMNLKDEGYLCRTAADGEAAADLFEKERFDLVLLDIMLPKVNGYELLEYIQPSGVPVIFITARGTLDDRIRGLKLGAEDYIVKPFQIRELLARVEVVLRRYGKTEQLIEIGDVSVNISSRIVKRNGVVIDFTSKEFDLLVELIYNRNIALRRQQLYERVWEEPYDGQTRTLDSHIQRIRGKLGWQDRIKTVFRVGYRLEIEK